MAELATPERVLVFDPKRKPIFKGWSELWLNPDWPFENYAKLVDC
jgi:hypothetical protein